MDVTSAATDPRLTIIPHRPQVPNRPSTPGVHAAGGPDAMARTQGIHVYRAPDVQSVPRPPAPPQTTTSPHPPAIAAMFADWGASNSPHNLDGDGAVGMRDFFELMRQLGADPNRAQVNALFRDWGRSDSSPHDLDGNGTVGIRDFFDLMRGLSGAPRQESARTQQPEEPAAAEAPAEPSRQATADAAIATPERPERRADRPSAVADGVLHRLRAVYGRAAAENVARAMLPLIANTDPDELRESLDKANLPTEQRRHVLERLGAWNPRGLTLNAVG